MLSFEGGDGGRVAQDVAELVDALQEAVLGKAVDREFNLASAWRGEGLGCQVDFDYRGRIGCCGEQLGMHVGRDNDGKQRVLERILFEDVGEGSADDGPETELR